MSSAAHLEGKTLTFILAGGEGDRLYPLTADQPKCGMANTHTRRSEVSSALRVGFRIASFSGCDAHLM
ncbi:MAG: hypothetical protein DMG13_23815 [Acidobacteria bacterium]|nr:MAG: hypothetical protein DMG13_23815 [Acidobacteriota bacterium]